MKDYNFFFCLETLKTVDPEDFKAYINSMEPRIQFTLKMEKYRTLNFTDLTTMRKDRKFLMKVHRKDTHTIKYMNWWTHVLMRTNASP